MKERRENVCCLLATILLLCKQIFVVVYTESCIIYTIVEWIIYFYRSKACVCTLYFMGERQKQAKVWQKNNTKRKFFPLFVPLRYVVSFSTTQDSNSNGITCLQMTEGFTFGAHFHCGFLLKEPSVHLQPQGKFWDKFRRFRPLFGHISPPGLTIPSPPPTQHTI